MFMLQNESQNICLPKAVALCEESSAMCENLLISTFFSSHWFVEHLKQCCTQYSESLLWTLVDEKEVSRKITSNREGTVSWTDAQQMLSWHN